MKNRKLVRDNIPDIIRKSGVEPRYRELTDPEEIRTALCNKIVEESRELLKANNLLDETIEVGDILDAIEEYILTRKLPRLELERLRRTRNRERGGYRKKIWLIAGGK